MFSGPRVVFPDGASPGLEVRAHFISASASFTSSIGVVSGPEEDTGLLKFLSVYLRSDLVRYFVVMSQYSVLVAQDRITLTDIKSLPFVPPVRHPYPEKAHAIVAETAQAIADVQGRDVFEQDRRYRNLRVVRDGVLYRCGQLTGEGFERVVREHGIRTVVSFRETRDDKQQFQDQFEEEICNAAGVEYHRFGYLDWGNPDGAMPARANIDKFLKLMDDPKVPKPVLVHCFAGIHRTGVHVASYRIERQGWSNADALAELQSMGTRRTTYSEDLVRFVNALTPRVAVGGIPPKR